MVEVKTVLTDIEEAVSGAVMQVIERNLEELEASDNYENMPAWTKSNDRLAHVRAFRSPPVAKSDLHFH
jgi:hypothetical protein